jgi:hypothetical protein
MLTNNQGTETNRGKGINRMNGKMIFKFAAVAAAVVCVASAHVYAATVNFAADDSNFFGLANGTPVPVGDAVYIGQFSISDAAVSALEAGGTVSQANYNTLVSDFVPLNVTALQLMGTGTGNPPDATSAGAIASAWLGTNPAFANGAIYVMVVNSATTVGASQVGVFRGDTSWTFPAVMTTGSVGIDTDNALTAPLIGSFVGGLAGTTVPFNESANGSGNSTIGLLELAPIAVPEPSSVMLVVTGLLGMLGLRRRS